MTRAIIGVLLAGLALFVWGFVYWVALGVPNAAINKADNEDGLRASIVQHAIDEGMYIFPALPDGEPTPEMTRAWEARHREGPVGMLVVYPDGKEPMPPMVFVQGIAINILGAGVAALLLWTAGPRLKTYIARVSFVTALGVFAGLSAYAVDWNWMFMPTDYTLIRVVELAVGWTIAGLVLASFVGHRRGEARREGTIG